MGEEVSKDTVRVLILVLMDNQNTKTIFLALLRNQVLILVLMDNQNTFIKCCFLLFLFCLNPCSNG